MASTNLINNVPVSSSGETVTVACKYPAGFWLHIDEMDDFAMSTASGLQIVKVARQKGAKIRLNGPAHAQDKAPKGAVVGGYGLTFGVPKDFWAEWLKQHGDSDIVRNGLIFAHSKPGHTEGDAKEKGEVPSGLERLDPARPPRGVVPGREMEL